jgi:hypothetical protein
MPPAETRPADIERWVSIFVRSAHIAGAAWVSAGVVAGPAVAPAAAWLLVASGLLLLAMDLYARRLVLGELAGAVVLVKLALAAWMALDPRQAPWIFWGVIVLSSVVAHAPKHVRHWRPGQVRASKASKPG